LTPVILLTSLDRVEDKLEGFDSGADDYLVKPFSFLELLARIKALNRRNREAIIKPNLRLADLEMDSITRKVRRDGKEIVLTATEYKILELMLDNKEKVIDRIMITEKIWGNCFDSGTNIIDVHINSLRKKIDKDFHPKLIHTRKGFGYLISDKE
jgi:DNA-binding response OmpR family regulator